MKKTFLHFIDGSFTEATSKKWIDVFNPATGDVYGQVSAGTIEDADLAVKSSKRAFVSWSKTKREERADFLFSLSNEIKKNNDELAELESIDTGKPLSLARTVDIPRASQNLDFFGKLILEDKNETFLSKESISRVIQKPRGVAGIISPWNLPLYLLTWKIAPAIATGNTVVAKPSELTPSTANRLCDLSKQIGLPNGVLNIIHGYGDEVGDALVKHEDVPTISFTGGTSTGQKIAMSAAPNFKRIALEMGGKNPSIVFEDADLEQAIDGVSRAAFTNMGQICLCGSRLLVQDTIYEKVLDGICKYASKLKIGNPLHLETDYGSLISKEQLKKVKNSVITAIADGGIIKFGGKTPFDLAEELSSGYYFEPTIIEGLSHKSKVVQNEIFGPLVTVHSFSNEEEAISMANCTEYGLSANIWTMDVERQNRLASEVEAGVIWINCWMVRDLRTPFGGMKKSGLGREGGFDALKFFTEPKSITSLE